MLDISVVIPLLNEEESLPELHAWIKKVMDKNKYSYEIIFIDDGSTDNSWQIITDLKTKNEEVKGIKFIRNYGKSAALQVSFARAKGKVVITMDADLQDSPEEIPELYKMIVEEDYDLVSGWKKKRYDPITKTLPTKIYNWFTRKMSGLKLNDFNCGLKAYKNKVVKSVEIYGDMHRYIPVLANWAGFKKIGEKVVQHQSRKYGVSKFGLERFINGPLDLISVYFMSRFRKKPMHFFGSLGILSFSFGSGIALYLAIRKSIALYHGNQASLIANSPFFYLGLTFIILGTMLFLTGFLGELISRTNPDRNNYNIEETL